jgi:hypothetical protein
MLAVAAVAAVAAAAAAVVAGRVSVEPAQTQQTHS